MLLALLVSVLQAASDLSLLEPEHPATHVLDDGHGAVEAGGLAGRGARGTTLRLRVATPGTYTLQLRSARFDAYLLLTDTDGAVLAEADDGWTGTQARLVVELDADRDYLVQACALEAGVGVFEISLHAGRRADVSAKERRAAEVADFRWSLAQLERELEEPEALSAELQTLAVAWFDRGYVEQGLEALRRRIAISLEVWGPGTAATACARYDHAFYLFQAGRLREAEPEMRSAVSALEKSLGPEDPTTLSVYIGLGHLEQARGRALEARAWFERAVEGYDERSETGSRVGIMADVGLAGTLISLGEYQFARDLLHGALANAEELGPAGEDMVSYALAALSELEILNQRYEAAYELMMRSRASFGKQFSPTHPNMMKADNNLLWILQLLGRTEELRELGEDLLSRLEATSRIGTRQHAILLLTLATAAHTAEDYDMALVRTRESARIAEEIGDQQTLAGSLGQLARTRQRMGHFAEVRGPLERSIELLRANEGESNEWATRLADLGALLYALGDDEEAADAFRRAAAWFEARGLDSSHSAALGGLGVSLIRLGREEEALSVLGRALSLGEKSGLPPGRLASDLSNLGLLHERHGRLERAREFFQRALDDLERSETRDTLVRATLLVNLATVQRRLGDPEGARESGLLALELAPHFEAGARMIALDNLALTWIDSGEIEEAWSTLMRGALRLRVETDAVLAASSEPERYRYLVKILSHLDHVLAVAKLRATPAARTSAYEQLLHWKGLVGRQLLATRERLAEDLSPELRALAEDLRERRTELAQQAWSADESGVEELRAEVARLERELQSQIDLDGASRGISFAQLRDALPDDAVVVDFAVHRGYGRDTADAPITARERILTAFVTRPGAEAPVWVELGPAAAIETALAAHLARIGARSTRDGSLATRGLALDGPSEPDTDPLRELLWQPLAPLVAGAETLFVVPEGALATLPFETLHIGDGRFLIEQHSVVTLSDAGFLTRVQAPSGDRLDSLLVLGDVDYGSRAALDEATLPSLLRSGVATSWAPLPATGVEADGIIETHENIFGAGGRRLELRGAEATEERLLDELGRFGTVHLATHGYFHPTGLVSSWDAVRGGNSGIGGQLAGRRPGLLSGLVCAGANTQALGRADGYLTAEELGSADLTGVELVVLSACETGLGRAQAGEGLLGMRRAFLTAGANTVVSSLWSVPDAPTAQLMQAFYDNLWRLGLGRRAALRAAQLELLERNRRELSRPAVHTWGAFVLDGEWR